MLLLQPFEQTLGGGVRLLLQPNQNLSPNRFERILSSPPRTRLRRGFSVSRACFTSAPEIGERREELIQTLAPWAARWVFGSESCQCSLGIPDAMQQLDGIESITLLPQSFLDPLVDCRVFEQALTWRCRLEVSFPHSCTRSSFLA